MNTKLTHEVMNQVVKYEQRRTRRWWRVFGLVLGVVVIIGAITVYTIVKELREEETLSIINIVREDGVPWLQASGDIVGVIWESLSHQKIYAFAGAVALVTVIVSVTSHQRRVLGRKKKDIRQYHTKTDDPGPSED